MSRLQRKLLLNCLALGASLTLLVVVLHVTRALGQVEVWLYDRRAQLCQRFMPQPTDKLVHLDVDDNAVNVIGRFPWPRTVWAELLKEIHIAGPRAIEMDFIFSEEEKPAPGAPPPDRLLAGAIAECGNVILGASFDAEVATSPLYRQMVEQLKHNVRQTEQQIVQSLGAADESQRAAVVARYFAARAQAIHDIISEGLSGGASEAQIRKSVLGTEADEDVRTATQGVFDEQLQHVLAERALVRFSAAVTAGFPADASSWFAARPPIRVLTDAADGAAFVEYPNFEDGISRTVPMLLRCNDRVYGQMGLILACKMLGTTLDRVRIDGSYVVIARAGVSDIRIPTTRLRTDSKGEKVAMLMDIPWFGSRDWLRMYGADSHHVSLLRVWQASQTQRKISDNLKKTDESLLALLHVLDPAKEEAFRKNPPADVEERFKLMKATLEDAATGMEPLRSVYPTKLTQDEQKYVGSFNALTNVMKQDADLRAQLSSLRSELAAALKDRAALIGYTGTGGAVDVVPTSLHDKCPGVVVHGVVFNGIVTGEMWRRAPIWVAIAIIVVLGMFMAATTGFLPPVWAALLAIVTAFGYALINGYFLFDYGNLIVPAASPLLAVILVWAGCAVWKAVVENSERRRITQRFQNYVEPDLVNYYLDHPEELGLKGKMREMTVVFTDLAGFTTLSEKLGAQIVEMLNEFMGLMVPVIRKHHGHVNKFLGDGIMFFMGAPAANSSHARDAVAAVLEMQRVVDDFSRRLRARGLPPVMMRAGVLTGDMTVGDAGSDEKRDYTVIGNTVNLASRLEGANKATGTLVLASHRAAELIGDEFLLRPVGTLLVVGKTQGERAFEVVCRITEASDEQKRSVAMTGQMIDAFVAGRFADCLELCEQMDGAFGASKLADMYRNLCVQYLRDPPGEFSGVIVLTEK